MGLRDILTGRHAVKGPAPERLFAISTAYVTLRHVLRRSSSAASPGSSSRRSRPADFQAVLQDTEEVVKATAGDNGTSVTTEDDATASAG